ncbi:polyprenyl diphosphate synthase [Nocardia wallacei]|uniref:polyprenyl diphosphate synthase n=1 Tax=Nocardia wallacei TaxID=480035 RepID=UPI0024560F6B|nr:polyprenyl diphosphate synthase [Nocardia wallacei]
MQITDPMDTFYVRRLRRQLAGARLPRHVALIMDGNRRWARNKGLTDIRLGYRHGGEQVKNVLVWCESLGIRHVTQFLCSIENLHGRRTDEIDFVMKVVEDLVTQRLGRPDSGWQLHIAGSVDALPDTTARILQDGVDATRHCTTGSHITLALGYSGRQEIVDACRDLLNENSNRGKTPADIAHSLTVDDLATRLYTADQPDPDLVIRTGGEQRLSNFLLWQSAYTELYFCEAYGPDFREIDFLRALRDFTNRHRHYGR